MLYNPEVSYPTKLANTQPTRSEIVRSLFRDHSLIQKAHLVIRVRTFSFTPRQTSVGVRFTQFKLKLSLVPLIFIFTRTWSETRTIILAVNPRLDVFWLQVTSHHCPTVPKY